MRLKRTYEVPAEMTRLARRLAKWRASRKRGDRIPARLWNGAVALGLRHGVSRTASALKLGYYELQRRVQREAPATGCPAPARQRFEELPPPPFSTPNECVMEFEDSLGARLRIEWRGNNAPDFVALGHDFWNAG
jgi:hypothetical protein